jgi:hypothetical protein
VVDSHNCVVTIRKFAQLLAEPVTTLKRLFAKEVLDPALLEKTDGGHWRVRFSPDDLLICCGNIAIWEVLRRKPRIARSYEVRDPVRKFGAELTVLEHEIDSRNKTRRVVGPRVKSALPSLVERRLRKELTAYKRALIILKKRRPHTEPLWWYEKMLEHPKEFAGTFILRLAIQRFRANYRRFPKRIEIARELNISERSLYRRPFGREAVRLACRGPTIPEIETQDDMSEDREESYIHELEQELSPERRRWLTRPSLTLGMHEVQRRRLTGDRARRKLRREKARRVELAWEQDPIGPGEMLRMYPVGGINAKHPTRNDQ